MATQSEAKEPKQEGVLADLDEQGTTSFYWYLAVLSCIGGFLFGYDTAVIGSVLDFIPYELSDFQTGYLVAGASLGAAAGALLAGPFTDRFGRKSLLIIDAAIYARRRRSCPPLHRTRRCFSSPERSSGWRWERTRRSPLRTSRSSRPATNVVR